VIYIVEEWKDIDGFSRYKVSNFGRVLNINTNKFLKGTIERNGYLKYLLKDDNNKLCSIAAHLLVARLFLHNPSPKEKNQVNHIDEDKANPHVSNLEWVSPSQNSNHGTRNKRISKKLSMPVNEYDLEGKYIRTWKSSQYVAKIYPVTARLIQSAAKREGDNGCTCQTGYGRQWRYLNDNNTNNIEPINSKKIRQYNKNVNHDSFVIPDEYLYKINKVSEKDRCLNIISDLIQDKAFSTYYLSKIKEIENYITNQ